MSGPPVYSFRKKVTETNEFKYTNSVSAFETITVPATGTNDFIIDWGDGSGTEVVTTSSPSHEYVDADSYQISIDGDMSSFAFGNGGNKLNITSLDQWGDMGFTNLGLRGAFWGCSNMTAIPNAPITGADAITSCVDIFRIAGITSIPSGLFDNTTLVTNFERAFRQSSITSIPSGLFDNNTLVTSFSNTFFITSITSIPSGLFDFNTLATIFESTFFGANITSIPSGLFDNNILVISFSGTFNQSNITSIPSGLFDNNPLVTTFRTVFQNTDITSIPNNLFVNNPNVTRYDLMFDGVPGGISLPATIFTLSNLGIVTSFDNAFKASGSGFSGTAQDIWNFATSATSINTYQNQTNISNYADIPNDWKGL